MWADERQAATLASAAALVVDFAFCFSIFSACPVSSYRNRLGMVGRLLPHFIRDRASVIVRRSRARVTPT